MMNSMPFSAHFYRLAEVDQSDDVALQFTAATCDEVLQCAIAGS